MKFQL